MPQNATLFNGVIAEDNSVLETMSRCLVICYQCFGGACCLLLQGKKKVVVSGRTGCIIEYREEQVRW